MKSPSILEKFNVKLRKNAKSQSYCVLNERETSFLTGIWITSSSIFSHGVSLKASISIRSSYLYSNYYHAKRFFGNLIFLPLLLECCVEIILNFYSRPVLNSFFVQKVLMHVQVVSLSFSSSY